MRILLKLIDLGRASRVTRSGFIGLVSEPGNPAQRYNP